MGVFVTLGYLVKLKVLRCTITAAGQQLTCNQTEGQAIAHKDLLLYFTASSKSILGYPSTGLRGSLELYSSGLDLLLQLRWKLLREDQIEELVPINRLSYFSWQVSNLAGLWLAWGSFQGLENGKK